MRLGPYGAAPDTLFEAELAPPDEVAVRAAANADLRLMLSKHNRVIVQRPTIQAVEQVDASSVQLPWPAPRFFRATTTVGCAPDPDCRFTWVRIEIELGQADEADERPIACLLVPDNGEDELHASGGLELTGELKLGHPDLASAGLTFTRRREHSGSQYRYRVFTFGKMGSSVAWDFRATEVHPEISGDLTLYLVFAMAPGRRSGGEVTISARAELRAGGPPIPLIMRRSLRDLRANAFDLVS